ncbi:MAG TPA: HAD family phosphatase, partial [Burkholderiaceae bacterium]|nr:HAD family phosphatase [Burkholderiaceae bacterium]
MVDFVFDLGAVVFDWRPQELLARTLPLRASTPEAAAALASRFFGGYGGDWWEFDRGTIDVPELVTRLAGHVGLAEREVMQVVDAVPEALLPIPETIALMGELRDRGHRLRYLSNMPAPYADELERRHPFGDWFEGGGLFSSRVRRVKPEPEIFALAAARLGIRPEKALFIDDSPANVEAARACGWQAVCFSGAGSLRE